MLAATFLLTSHHNHQFRQPHTNRRLPCRAERSPVGPERHRFGLCAGDSAGVARLVDIRRLARFVLLHTRLRLSLNLARIAPCR
jgi:hypothetical protein